MFDKEVIRLVRDTQSFVGDYIANLMEAHNAIEEGMKEQAGKVQNIEEGILKNTDNIFKVNLRVNDLESLEQRVHDCEKVAHYHGATMHMIPAAPRKFAYEPDPSEPAPCGTCGGENGQHEPLCPTTSSMPISEPTCAPRQEVREREETAYTCESCGKPIYEGELFYYDKDDIYWHRECPVDIQAGVKKIFNEMIPKINTRFDKPSPSPEPGEKVVDKVNERIIKCRSCDDYNLCCSTGHVGNIDCPKKPAAPQEPRHSDEKLDKMIDMVRGQKDAPQEAWLLPVKTFPKEIAPYAYYGGMKILINPSDLIPAFRLKRAEELLDKVLKAEIYGYSITGKIAEEIDNFRKGNGA
jgi:hypothetical protein